MLTDNMLSCLVFDVVLQPSAGNTDPPPPLLVLPKLLLLRWHCVIIFFIDGLISVIFSLWFVITSVVYESGDIANVNGIYLRVLFDFIIFVSSFYSIKG